MILDFHKFVKLYENSDDVYNMPKLKLWTRLDLKKILL
jgi:hypothetical protein